MGDGFRSLPHNTSQQVESFLSSIVDSRTNATLERDVPISTVEFGQTVIRGTLYRKDRLKWSRCFCLVRNSFLECHKNKNALSSRGKPLLKLLLLGSQVTSLQVCMYIYISRFTVSVDYSISRLQYQ